VQGLHLVVFPDFRGPGVARMEPNVLRSISGLHELGNGAASTYGDYPAGLGMEARLLSFARQRRLRSLVNWNEPKKFWAVVTEYRWPTFACGSLADHVMNFMAERPWWSADCLWRGDPEPCTTIL